MQENGFILVNGRFPGDAKRDYTFFNANGASTVDLIWVNYQAATKVQSLVVDEETYDSDHFPCNLWVKSRAVIPNMTNGTTKIK